MKAAPLTATAFGLVIVIFRTEAAFGTMLAGANALATVTWPSTASVPATDEVVPALLAVIAPLLLR